MRVALVTCARFPDLPPDDLPLRDSLRARGVDVVAAVWDDAEFDWRSCDAAIVRATWDYCDRHGEFLEWVRRASARTRLFNAPEVIAWNSRKRYLAELAERGFETPRTVWLERGARADLGEIVRRAGFERAIVKPVIGATARHTVLADPKSLAAAQAHLDARLAEEAMAVQEFLPRVTREGELSLAFFDGEFSHAVRKRPAPGDFRVQVEHGGSTVPADVAPSLVSYAQSILAAAPAPTLYARVDLVEHPGGAPRLMELELIEPELYLRHAPCSSDRFADAIVRRA